MNERTNAGHRKRDEIELEDKENIMTKKKKKKKKKFSSTQLKKNSFV